jgi:uracil-DNA glycosylase family 4
MAPNKYELAVRKHPCAKCEDCPLLEDGRFVPAKLAGNEILYIGEAPGRDEVKAQEPFVGASGQILSRAIRKAGGDPEQVDKTNVVACQPPNNDLRGYEEAVEMCWPRLKQEIEEHPGKKVVALGKIAAEVVIGAGARLREEAALPPAARRGRWFTPTDDSPLKGKRVLSEYHPAYVARKPSEMSGFEKGIQRAHGPVDIGALLQPPEIVHINTVEGLQELIERAPAGSWVAFDLETNQVQWYDRPAEVGDTILMMVMTWSLKRTYVIDPDVIYHPMALPWLQTFFDKFKTIAHNGKFDVVFLRTVGVRGRVDFDTMLAHFVLAENDPHGLKRLAQDEYGIPDYEAEIIKKYLRTSNDWYSKIPYLELALYAAWDGTVTRALKERFEKRLRARPAFAEAYKHIATQDETREATAYEWPFMNLLMKAQDFLSDTEHRGIGVDVPYLQVASKAMEEELEEHRKQLRAFCGRPEFNPNAHAQVASVLYDDRKLPNPKVLEKQLGTRLIKSKIKDPTRGTSSGILDALVQVTGDPFAKRMKEYRRVAKIKSSYIDNMLWYCDTRGRVHADFRVMGTEVGRLAVRDPALQTIPRPKDYYGQAIRGAFIATPYTREELDCYLTTGERCPIDWDWLARDPVTGQVLHASLIPDPSTLTDEDIEAVLVIADYSQAELRAAAHYSGEPFLRRVYEEGRDLHTEGTLGMFGTVEDIAKQRGVNMKTAQYIWDELRVDIKMFNFAYLYGGNENSFAQDKGIPIAQARAFVRRYEANMPVLAQWKKDQYRDALRYGYVVTVHGRRRSFPELGAITQETRNFPENKKILDDVRKASVHAVVAGTASDNCILAAHELASHGLEVELLVHDSILIRCPRFLAKRLEVLLPQVMSMKASYWLPSVKWKADTKVVTRWAEPPEDLLDKLKKAA